jgi:hypothetical protein
MPYVEKSRIVENLDDDTTIRHTVFKPMPGSDKKRDCVFLMKRCCIDGCHMIVETSVEHEKVPVDQVTII